MGKAESKSTYVQNKAKHLCFPKKMHIWQNAGKRPGRQSVFLEIDAHVALSYVNFYV